MALIVEIKGDGKVEKVVEGNSITLTAIPDDHWMFKHFMVGNEKINDNPTTIDAGKVQSVIAAFYVTIEDFLKGQVGFDIPGYVLNSIRINRGIARHADVMELTDKQKELAFADLLMWAATNPTTYTGARDSDGGWSHQESSQTLTVTDKKRFEEMANQIYKKHSDGRYSVNIKIVNLR